MLPATKAIPKEMLPVVDKPLIQYVVAEAIAAGIKQIVLVTHSSKNSIENHFDKSFELEAQLEKRLKRQLLAEVQSICPKDVSIMHIRQAEAKGLGHAILAAHPVVGDNPFVVILPDVLINEYSCNLKTENLARMLELFDQDGTSQIMLEEVPRSEVNQYGIADLNGKELAPGESAPMTSIVEKPDIESAPSNLSVVGRYVLSSKIWDCLDFTPPGAGGEIQLTDAIASLMKQEPVNAFYMTGKSNDCGSKLGYMKANLEYGIKHSVLGDDFKQIVKDLAKTL
ncbi:MAG: UTP--glucose-1-phosphate uridylyltransferase GalU [Psychrosphaera sp.]|nr:UTP--glucose-1-phosphate uridylyltransferase GalU [Psychrosphaera sp.]